ncbi:S1 family peptidase [Candidatus Protochlamydia sp. W-9]|uniref:S1 family peptidase n=1 Tax=Candidatus Protochlamydia sp. W-9 TaxID=1785087 RepID=UPI00096A4D52|nr:serine protease [Candidatus Protochlamydia sp. W-9]
MNAINPSPSADSSFNSPFSKDREERSRIDLSTAQVFDKMRPLICSINSTIGEASGFFIDHEGTILTAAHNIPEEEINGVSQFIVDYLQINYGHQEQAYFPTSNPDIIQQHAKALDLYSIKLDSHKIQPEEVIPFLPETIQLKEGMKVYFAGYPLGQDKVTFHKGIISSITENQGIKRFTIDGTVVPGNSGGPVLIQDNGQVYLVGVITSEVADFSYEDREVISDMKLIRDSNSGYVIDYHRTYTTPEGEEIKKVITLNEILYLALDLIQRNLSTGIGKAIDIRHYEKLFQEQIQLTEDKDSFSVGKGKGKKLIDGEINSEQQQVLAKYIEVRYGKGAGNRGIRIMLCQALGTGTSGYKFSPNPHTAPGNYNKNQTELYLNAAKEIVKNFMEQNRFLKTITFDACQHTYSAELEE